MSKFLFFRVFFIAIFSFFTLSIFTDADAGTAHTITGPGSKNTSVNILSADNLDSVTFNGNGSGILASNHAGGTRTLASISSVVPTTTATSAGNIIFSTNGNLNISGRVGSSTNKIKKFEFSAASSNAAVTFNNDVYVAQGIATTSNGAGNAVFIGTSNGNGFTVNSSIGASGLALASIQVGDSGGTITFDQDIFTGLTSTSTGGKMRILSSATNVNLGNITLANLSSLTLDGNTQGGFYDGDSTSTLTIASGKDLSISSTNTLGIAGTLNLGVTFDATNNLINSSNTATVDSNAIFNLNYSNATELDVGTETLISAVTTLTTASCAPNCTNTITDTSILLDAAIAKSGQTLVLTTSINNDVKDSLGAEEQDHVNRILSGDLLVGTSFDKEIRTEMLKISDIKTLEGALDSLEEERNNMIQTTSLDISNRIQNIINYRTMALNYNYIGFSSGNKRQESGSVWGEFFGGYSKQDERLNEEGYSSTIGGAVFGADGVLRGFSTDVTIGLALSYTNANVRGDSVADQNTDINSYQATLYNNNVASNGMGLFNENSLTFGYNQYDSNRNIKIGLINKEANADYNGTQLVARTGLGYNFKVANKLFFSPNASIRYSSLSIDDYTETGAGSYGLDVNNETFDTLATDVGFRVMGEVDTGNSNYSLFPQLNLSWTKNLDTDGREVETSFIGSTTKTKNIGIDLIDNLFNFGIQLNVESKEAASFILKYELQGGKDYLGHLGSIRYRVAF